MNRSTYAPSLRTGFIAALVLLAGGAISVSPAAADQVLTLSSHSDAMKMMGQTTPAKDETHTYWFGEQATRYDLGATSIILRLDTKKFYVIDHTAKTYSPIDLPFDFSSLVGPEMAPAMEMMAKQTSVTVTPSDRTGNFAGFDCTYAKIDVKMMMMNMTTDSCNSEKLPIDFSRYQAIQESYSQILPNQSWIKEMAGKVRGFPIHSETTMNVMGSAVKMSQELKSIEDKPAPAGNYDPPAGYAEKKYDPMAAAQQRGRHG